MSRFRILLWLKWRLLLSQLKGPQAVTGQILVWVMGAVLGFLALAVGLGLFLWLLPLVDPGQGGMVLGHQQVLLSSLLAAVYLGWSLGAILPTRGTGLADPVMLLHFPITTRHLFFLDLSSDLARGAVLFILPSLVAIHLAPAVAVGHPAWAILPALLTLSLALGAARLLELIVTVVTRRSSRLGEILLGAFSVLAFFGVMIALSSGPLALDRLMGRTTAGGLVMTVTPPALAARMLTAIASEDLFTYLIAGLVLALQSAVTCLLALRLWQWLILDRTSRPSAPQKRAAPGLGHFLQGTGAQSALLEKELKYLFRNRQVRALFILPLFFLLFKMGYGWPAGAGVGPTQPSGEGLRRWLDQMGQGELEGLPGVLAIGYLLLFYAVLCNNLFGMEGHGFGRYQFLPIPKSFILASKNQAILMMMFTQGVCLLVLNQIVFGDMSLADFHIVVTTLITGGFILAGTGNFLSIFTPRQCPYGRRLEAGRWALVLMIPQVLLALVPSLGAFGIGLWLENKGARNALLALQVPVIVALYAGWMVPRAARALQRAEARISATVEGGEA